MATPVIMPRQGQSVESCIIGKWHKQKGDSIKSGDILFSYETDKATFEEEAKADGILLDVFYEEGDEVECLKIVCVIGNEGENIDEFKSDAPTTPLPSTASEPTKSAASTTLSPSVGTDLHTAHAHAQTAAPTAGSGTHPISPRARIFAEKTGADVTYATPTGANNRIMEIDVRNAISAGHYLTKSATGDTKNAFGTGIGGRITPADIALGASVPFGGTSRHLPVGAPNVPDSEDVKLSSVRKFIAKAMHSSLSESAQLTHHSTFDATDILTFRKNLKTMEDRPELSKITITDIIVYAASRVLLKHRSMNAHFLGDSMTLFNNTHIGLAVDTPRGLLVPTIFNANAMSLSEISMVTKEKIEKSRQGSIGPDELKGGTFTISNIGGFGIEVFTPVLNPPQTGILGVCCIVERTKSGKTYPAMGLSLTYDHRALDGADAGRFQKELMDYLEKFSFNLALEGGSL